MARTRSLRLPTAIAAATGVALLVAGPASAHIDPDPTEVQAGAEVTVGFTVEHGCDESPTTQVEIQMPDGATGIQGVDGDGFTASVEGQVVTFSGGTLGADTEKSFEVTFTAPEAPGEAPVKIIQTCEVGSIDWIQPEVEGEPEPDHPAPVLTIVGSDDAGTTEPAEPTDSTGPAEPTDSAEPTIETTTETTTEEDESDSSIPVVAAVLAGVVVVGGGGALYARSRKQADDA